MWIPCRESSARDAIMRLCMFVLLINQVRHFAHSSINDFWLIAPLIFISWIWFFLFRFNVFAIAKGKTTAIALRFLSKLRVVMNSFFPFALHGSNVEEASCVFGLFSEQCGSRLNRTTAMKKKVWLNWTNLMSQFLSYRSMVIERNVRSWPEWMSAFNDNSTQNAGWEEAIIENIPRECEILHSYASYAPHTKYTHSNDGDCWHSQSNTVANSPHLLRIWIWFCGIGKGVPTIRGVLGAFSYIESSPSHFRRLKWTHGCIIVSLRQTLLHNCHRTRTSHINRLQKKKKMCVHANETNSIQIWIDNNNNDNKKKKNYHGERKENMFYSAVALAAWHEAAQETRSPFCGRLSTTFTTQYEVRIILEYENFDLISLCRVATVAARSFIL